MKKQVDELRRCLYRPRMNNRLFSQSEAVGHAGYSMPWYRYPRNLQNPVNMLMVRGQKPVRLTAGKFIELSLETFASMISTAASFFTMMRSMN